MGKSIFGGLVLGACMVLGGVAVVPAQDAPAVEAEAEEAVAEVSEEVMTQGAAVYQRQCSSCHGAEGQGGAGLPLTSNGFLGLTRPMLSQIVHGGAYMPGFSSLTDSDLAAVATYIRNSFGNEFGPVTEEEIANVR